MVGVVNDADMLQRSDKLLHNGLVVHLLVHGSQQVLAHALLIALVNYNEINAS